MTENWIQKICRKITDHKWRKLIAHSVHDENCTSDCKTEYYYQCRLCRAFFWNYSPPVGRQIPDWYRKDNV